MIGLACSTDMTGDSAGSPWYGSDLSLDASSALVRVRVRVRVRIGCNDEGSGSGLDSGLVRVLVEP